MTPLGGLRNLLFKSVLRRLSLNNTWHKVGDVINASFHEETFLIIFITCTQQCHFSTVSCRVLILRLLGNENERLCRCTVHRCSFDNCSRASPLLPSLSSSIALAPPTSSVPCVRYERVNVTRMLYIVGREHASIAFVQHRHAQHLLGTGTYSGRNMQISARCYPVLSHGTVSSDITRT